MTNAEQTKHAEHTEQPVADESSPRDVAKGYIETPHGLLIYDPQFHSPLVDKKLTVRPLGTDREIELSVGMVRRYLAKPTAKGFLPGDADIMKFIMMCVARGLDPWVGDAFMIGYDREDGAPEFNLIVSIQALLKRADHSQNFDGFSAGIVLMGDDHAPPDSQLVYRRGAIKLESDVLIGGWASVERKDREIPFAAEVQFSVYNTYQSRWKKDPAGMIRKCALAAALREAFPNLTGGLYVEEEFSDRGSLDVQVPESDMQAASAPDLPPGQEQQMTVEDVLSRPVSELIEEVSQLPVDTQEPQEEPAAAEEASQPAAEPAEPSAEPTAQPEQAPAAEATEKPEETKPEEAQQAETNPAEEKPAEEKPKKTRRRRNRKPKPASGVAASHASAVQTQLALGSTEAMEPVEPIEEPSEKEEDPSQWWIAPEVTGGGAEPEEFIDPTAMEFLNGLKRVTDVDKWETRCREIGMQAEAVEYFASLKRDAIRQQKLGKPQGTPA